MIRHFLSHIFSLLLLFCTCIPASAITITAVDDAQVEHAYLNNVASESTLPTAAYPAKNQAASATTRINLGNYYAQILTALGLSENAAGQQLYIRWYIENADGTLADLNGKLSATTTGKGHIADTQCLYWTSSLSTTPLTSANAAAVLNVSFQNASVVGQKVVALIAKLDDTNTITTADGAVTAEPAHFQLKYIFRLVDQTNANDCYIVNPNLPVATQNHILCSPSTTTLTYNTPTGNDIFTRWYVVNKATGNIVDNCADWFSSVDTNWVRIGTFCKTPYGMTVFSRATATSNPGGIRLTVPTGEVLSDYKVVMIQGSANSTSGLVAGNIAPKNEKYPNYFVAQDPSTITNVTEYIYEKPHDFGIDSVRNADVDLCRTFNLAPGYTDNNATTTKVYLANYYDKIISDLGLTNQNVSQHKIYIRWYVENEDGTFCTPEGTFSADMSTTAGHIALTKGMYWYSGMSTMAFNSNNKTALLNLSYAAQGTLGKRIVMLVANADDDTNPLTLTNGSVSAEPAHFQLKYIFRLVDQTTAQANYVTTPFTGTAIQEPFSCLPSATYFVLPTLRTSDQFQRWYLVNKNTGEVIENSQQYFTNVDNDWEKRGSFYKTPQGMTVYSRTTALSAPGNLRITLPDGLTLQDIKVVCLYSNNVNGLVAGNITNVNHLYTDYFVAQDPVAWTSMTEYTYVAYSFEHSSGYAYNYDPSGLKNGRQQVSQWDYTYYVKPGEQKKLIVPIAEDNPGVDGNPLEPTGYWRWYDNATDRACPYLSTDAEAGSLLKEICYDEDEQSYGLFKFQLQDKSRKNTVASVWFNTPSSGWTGSDVACDLSRYKDYQGNKSTMKYEPTLSLRYLFKVRPASEIAANIKKSLLSGSAYEDNGYITLGLYSGNKGNFTIRLAISDLSMYYFYPYTNHDFAQHATEAHFGSEMQQGKSVTWTVITRIGKKYYYRVLTNNNDETAKLYTKYGLDVNMQSFLGEYKSTDADLYETTDDVKDINEINFGKPYYVVGYINNYDQADATNKCSSPVATYTFYFRAESAPEDLENLPYNRTEEVLKKNYTKVAEISFDDFEGMNYNKPTKMYTKGDPNNNIWEKPIDWSRTYYGFVYPELGATDKMDLIDNWLKSRFRYAPYHGDYVFLKSMNDSVASPNQPNGGPYWANEKLYDVTYYRSGGTKYGYFAYVDATDEARPVISATFDANLCEGSTLVASIAIANMSDKKAAAPELVFKIYGEALNQETGETERQLVQSFASGDFKSVGATETGKWYQIYAPSVIAAGTHPERFSKFVITVDNQGTSTGGNDFAIDDIRIYAKNPKIEVLQQSDDVELCKNRENGAKLKLSMVYSQAKEALSLTDNDDPATDEVRPLFFRLCHASNGQPVSIEYGDSTYNRGHTAEYGCILVHSTDALNRKNIYIDQSEYAHLILANRFFKLDPEQKYYVSIAPPQHRVINGIETYVPSTWGTPDATCSIYSESTSYVQQDAVITDENGAVNATFSAECGARTVNVSVKGRLSLPDGVNGGRLEVTRWPFDWFAGSVVEYNSISGLNLALADFRAEYPDATSLQPAKGTFSEADHDLLEKYVTGVTDPASGYKHKLYLSASNVFNETFDLPEDADRILHLCLLPIPGTYTDSRTLPAQTFTICGYPLETTITLTHDGPVLNLGYPSVTYPDAWTHTARYLRLGLQHLQQLEQSNTYLRVPIHSYVDAQRPISTNLHNLQFIQQNASTTTPGELILASTTDPMNTAHVGQTIGTVLSSTITPTDKNISISLAPATTNGITFHEGYDYTLSMSYHDATQDASHTNTCHGTTLLTLQVVPEYVTWTNVKENNNNWNFDGNWRRASRSELYKTDYQDYGSADLPQLSQAPTADAATSPEAYVPMRFTKVIMPNGVEPPFLGSYAVDTKDSILTYLDNAVNAPATDNIAYCLMARMQTTTTGTNHFIDCERFYANTCDQVYFKPRGELRNQQYLDYNKAWVDFELSPDQWTLWTSPLKDVYAGDFYVPSSTGRQQTEAYKDINFSASENSRSGYPIYQRSWDHTGSLVITDPSDPLRNDYDAYIDYESYSGTDPLAVLQQWSNRYNDMTVPYAPGHGAAVLSEDKPHTGQSTLIRLPKADTSYTYYTASGQPKQSVALPARTEPGRLATSDASVTDPQKLSGRIVLTIDQANQHADNGYYLVGNPYMATLYMKRFFDQNTQLYPKYWTLVDGEMKAFDASAANSVPPMTAFFVKPVSGTLLQNIEFTSVMTVPYTSSVRNTAQAQLTLTAHQNHVSTRAEVISQNNAKADFSDAEDVEAMFDSNTLTTHPVLYTMAGQMAAAINHVPDLRNVPLAVLSADTTDVFFSVTGMELLRHPVYLYDAQTHTSTPLVEGQSVSIRPNVQGRYSLTSEAIQAGPVQTALRCFPIGDGRITVSTAPNDRLTSVLVFDPAGRLVREFTPSATTATYTIPLGTYLVTLSSEAVPEGRTFKVAVR